MTLLGWALMIGSLTFVWTLAIWCFHRVLRGPVILERRLDRSNNPLRRLYAWVIDWAETRWATPALVVVAFVESSFFPVPPDALLVPMALANPRRALRLAAWCTLGSVLGGLFGYLLGSIAWSLLAPHLLGVVFSAEDFEAVMGRYESHGFLAVFVAAFTPIPYKVFTLAAGVAQLPLAAFVVASILGRGARFFAVGGLIAVTGSRARALIERYFDLLTVAAVALLALGLLVARVL